MVPRSRWASVFSSWTLLLAQGDTGEREKRERACRAGHGLRAGPMAPPELLLVLGLSPPAPQQEFIERPRLPGQHEPGVSHVKLLVGLVGAERDLDANFPPAPAPKPHTRAAASGRGVGGGVPEGGRGFSPPHTGASSGPTPPNFPPGPCGSPGGGQQRGLPPAPPRFAP